MNTKVSVGQTDISVIYYGSVTQCLFILFVSVPQLHPVLGERVVCATVSLQLEMLSHMSANAVLPATMAALL